MDQEARNYGYSFLQKINERFRLYGNGHRRLIVPSSHYGEVIAYVIKGGEIELMSWDEVKRDHPKNPSLEEMLV